MKSPALVFLASLALVAQASSAFAEASPRTVQSGKAEHWESDKIAVVLDGSISDMGPGAQDAVVNAFGAWMASGAAVSQVVANRTTERGVVAQDGVNRILFGPITIAGHEKDVAVTVSYADSETGVIHEADTIFNSAYAYSVLDASDEDDVSHSDKCGKKYDVQNVATHEFGHFFGLGEDMSETSTTMFIQSAPCQTHKRELTADDRTAIASLYVSSSAATAPQQTVSTPSSCAMSPASRESDSSIVLFLFAAALAFMIRRGSDTRTCRVSSPCNRPE